MMGGQSETPRIVMRSSQLARARGAGAAHTGAAKWWAERLTAVALVPLTLWFIASAMRLENGTRADMIAWLHAPVPLTLMLCLIVATFWHMDLGLRVSVEDYVHHEGARTALLLLIRGVSVVAAILCVISALRLGL